MLIYGLVIIIMYKRYVQMCICELKGVNSWFIIIKNSTSRYVQGFGNLLSQDFSFKIQHFLLDTVSPLSHRSYTILHIYLFFIDVMQLLRMCPIQFAFLRGTILNKDPFSSTRSCYPISPFDFSILRHHHISNLSRYFILFCLSVQTSSANTAIGQTRRQVRVFFS